MTERRQVAVVTGGGGGIGAAVAQELGRTGWFVVTVDPLVTVDGAEQLPPAEETTAGRIVAAGGAARASSVSVTDGPAVRSLFEELVAAHGGLDAVVNVAGITRPTSYGGGEEADWLQVLRVHLDGYLNVLEAALPLMAAAGRGRILGVTSGSGWRAADAGAYSCAKRAVAALTWQLGRVTPPGVSVNAMSPIAATRMVAAALARAGAASGAAPGKSARGGLSLASMPAPEELGPIGAHLVGDGFGWCRGRVIFAAGSEVAVVDEPRLVEVVRTDGAASLAHVIETVVPKAFAVAEAAQSSSGGSNARFGAIFDEQPAAEQPPSLVRSCAVISDRASLAAALCQALEARGVSARAVELDGPVKGFEHAREVLAAAGEQGDAPDAVVIAAGAGPAPAAGATGWEQVLAEHRGLVEQIHADAAWTRAVADQAAASGQPVRLVTLTDATTSGGRSRAQACAQQARVGQKTTGDAVTPFTVGLEAGAAATGEAAAELAAHLVAGADTAVLAGAELAVGAGWLGLRRHPTPTGSVTYGGPAVPGWLDDALREIAR